MSDENKTYVCVNPFGDLELWEYVVICQTSVSDGFCLAWEIKTAENGSHEYCATTNIPEFWGREVLGEL